ncbi:hypothetical protein [Streptomyces pseudogriseolus]|uniref:hypothetical protein n=1 Tax=Streptomyces pseudogriseolus TaxID=36817 RepID=UPI003FA1A7E8
MSGAFTNGTDVITALCSSSRAQRWRVDDDRGLLQSAADPDFCLDSRELRTGVSGSGSVTRWRAATAGT